LVFDFVCAILGLDPAGAVTFQNGEVQTYCIEIIKHILQLQQVGGPQSSERNAGLGSRLQLHFERAVPVNPRLSGSL